MTFVPWDVSFWGCYTIKDKRINILFPLEHPIWKYPEGQRSGKIREWVDIALKIEKELSDIKEELRLLRADISGRAVDCVEQEEKSGGFNVNGFLQAFEE